MRAGSCCTRAVQLLASHLGLEFASIPDRAVAVAVIVTLYRQFSLLESHLGKFRLWYEKNNYGRISYLVLKTQPYLGARGRQGRSRSSAACVRGVCPPKKHSQPRGQPRPIRQRWSCSNFCKVVSRFRPVMKSPFRSSLGERMYLLIVKVVSYRRLVPSETRMAIYEATT